MLTVIIIAIGVTILVVVSYNLGFAYGYERGNKEVSNG